jgi:predicted Ser/Thr protein kinase
LTESTGEGEERMVPPLGKLALERGLVTQAQLDGALKEQDAARQAGRRARPLGEILVGRGYLTPAQLDELLPAARKTEPEALPTLSEAPAPPRRAETPPRLRKREEKPSEPKTRRATRTLSTPFGKYTLLREIGRGGRGVVYEALDTVLNRKVALKMIHAEHVPDPEELEAEGRRFLMESRISASLPRHPAIVGVYEAGEIDGKRFLAMELIEGRPLLQWRKSGAATFETQIRLLRDVALALDHAHKHGVVHRDVKPQNILVDEEGLPHLTDWGLAKVQGQKEDLALALPGMVWGTPSHMSPEHARGKSTVDHRTDVWSLGVLLYEAIAGRPPYKADEPVQLMDKVVHEPVPPIGRFADLASLSPLHRALEPACMRALAKNPAERTAGARAFADALTCALEAGPRRKRKLLLAGTGAAAALLLGALLYLLLGGPDTSGDLERADRLLAGGQIQEALGLWERVLAAEPENPRAAEGKKAAQKRLREQIDAEKRKEVDEARRQEQERAQKEQDELKQRMAVKERADAEEALRLKVEQARLEGQLREERERAAEEARKKKAEEEAKPASPAPAAPPPPANPAPAPPPPSKPPAPPPAQPAPAANAPPPNPTGEPRALESGELHFEAEDYSGGTQPVAEVDFHDASPGNRGRAYRPADVDISPIQDGGFFVFDIDAGEWLRYKFAGGGRYQIEIHYANRRDGALHLEVDGVNVTGPIALPPLDKRTWGSATAVTTNLPPGSHDLRLVFDQPIQGVDWFRLKAFVPVAAPEAARVKEAERTIREAFKADYAKRSPADLAALGKKLLAEGQKVQDDPVARFALLAEARDVGAQAGDVPTAFAAIDELDRTFVVDSAAMKGEALATASRTAKTPDLARAVAEAHLPVIDAAVERDDYDGAITLAGRAEAAAKASGSASLLARIQAREKEIVTLASDFRQLKAHQKTLEGNAADPAANLAVGIFRCFTKGDWTRGLPLLAKGSDAPIAAAAQKEAVLTADANAQLERADAWREAGEKRTGPLKAKVLSRALYWYEKAAPALTGLTRLRVEGQLEGLYRAIYPADALRKGLVFWVEPAHSQQDPFRENVAGVKYVNNQAAVADLGTKALAFGRGGVDYAATEAVKGIDDAGSIFVWLRSDNYQGQLGGLVNRGEQEKRMDDFALWVSRGQLMVWFNVQEPKGRFQSRGSLAPNAWALAGVTWDDSAVTFYIDGREDSSFPNPPVLPLRRCARVSLGSDPPNGPEFFQGHIGSAMIYNRALPAGEVRLLYYGSRAKFR